MTQPGGPPPAPPDQPVRMVLRVVNALCLFVTIYVSYRVNLNGDVMSIPQPWGSFVHSLVMAAGFIVSIRILVVRRGDDPQSVVSIVFYLVYSALNFSMLR
jgi:hypothetical protein